MKTSLVLCVLLGAVFSVRAASVPRSVEADTVTTQPTVTVTVTGLYNDTTVTSTTVPTTPYTTTPSPTSPPSQSQIMCPEGWEVFLGRCYYYVNDYTTWSQAQSNCALLESMLVSVHSAQEYGFLQQLTKNTGNEVAWLGGFYLQDQWLWLDGSWFNNNTWYSQSTDSSNPCLLLYSDEGWINTACNADSYTSICVRDSNVPQDMLCPADWAGFQGRCYYKNSEPLSWLAANAHCAGLDASLASVHSPEEYSFLFQQNVGSGYNANWLGGFYFENQWMWLDGSWFYQGFFTELSPVSTYPCLATYYAVGWSNFMCDQPLPSVCVKDTVV